MPIAKLLILRRFTIRNLQVASSILAGGFYNSPGVYRLQKRFRVHTGMPTQLVERHWVLMACRSQSHFVGTVGRFGSLLRLDRIAAIRALCFFSRLQALSRA